MHYGYIYLTKSIDNEFIYIGQHTNNYVRKYNCIDKKYYGSGKILQNIIRKYGLKYLTCEILEWCDSKEQLNEREFFYVDKYKTIYGNKCCNIAKGGNQFSVYYLSVDERKAIKQKELATKNNKSLEEKKLLADRIRNTLLNKSTEEKKDIADRHSKTWFSKPLSERQKREFDRLKTRENWSDKQKLANSEACRKAKEKPVVITDGTTIIEFDSALSCSRSLGWYDCAAGMYIRKYSGRIGKRNSPYYGWKIYYK